MSTEAVIVFAPIFVLVGVLICMSVGAWFSARDHLRYVAERNKRNASIDYTLTKREAVWRITK